MVWGAIENVICLPHSLTAGAVPTCRSLQGLMWVPRKKEEGQHQTFPTCPTVSWACGTPLYNFFYLQNQCPGRAIPILPFLEPWSKDWLVIPPGASRGCTGFMMLSAHPISPKLPGCKGASLMCTDKYTGTQNRSQIPKVTFSPTSLKKASIFFFLQIILHTSSSSMPYTIYVGFQGQHSEATPPRANPTYITGLKVDLHIIQESFHVLKC